MLTFSPGSTGSSVDDLRSKNGCSTSTVSCARATPGVCMSRVNSVSTSGKTCNEPDRFGAEYGLFLGGPCGSSRTTQEGWFHVMIGGNAPPTVLKLTHELPSMGTSRDDALNWVTPVFAGVLVIGGAGTTFTSPMPELSTSISAAPGTRSTSISLNVKVITAPGGIMPPPVGSAAKR